MEMCLWRIQLVCIFIPSVCHGPLVFDDSIKNNKDASSHFWKETEYELTN